MLKRTDSDRVTITLPASEAAELLAAAERGVEAELAAARERAGDVQISSDAAGKITAWQQAVRRLRADVG